MQKIYELLKEILNWKVRFDELAMSDMDFENRKKQESNYLGEM